jgi:phosphatidylglycerol lysyltransferase
LTISAGQKSSGHLTSWKRDLRSILLPLVGIALFAAALWLLHRKLASHGLANILRELRTLPPNRVLAAIAVTVAAYLTMTLYDRLAIAYLKHPLAKRKTTMAAFISYAFSNNVGLSLLTSGSIRYRLYSTWGLSAEEITRLVLFSLVAFWLGILTVGGILFVTQPLALPGIKMLPLHSARPLGIFFLVLVASYLAWVIRRPQPVQVHGWRIPWPPPRLAFLQLVVGSLDWILSGSVLYLLLPAGAGLHLAHLLGIYLLAETVALISQVPGGLGVFESIVLLSAPSLPVPALAGALLAFRAIYYLLPLVVAAVLLGGHEVSRQREAASRAAQIAGHWGETIAPPFFALGALVAGAVLLFSGATPALPHRLAWLGKALPLAVLELSHFLASLVGAALLLLARGLQRRLDAAWLLTLVLLASGSVLSLLKGGDYEEALLLVLLLAALLPCRSLFYRKASLFAEPFTTGWITAILLVLGCSVWLGFFSYHHVPYSSQLWWQFTLKGNAPRFLRAEVGAAVLLLLFALGRLLRPAPSTPVLPDAEALDKADRVIAGVVSTSANLALLGDKALLFNEQGTAFIMYGIEGRSWVAMGDPVGPAEERPELAWRFRELCERHGGWPVFYEVGPEVLPLYLDMGLALTKLGEEARVPLANFSLEGGARSGLRHARRHLEKQGCDFEIVPPAAAPDLMTELQTISDAWLAEKNTREKGFSLGFFNPGYLARFPLALVRRERRIIAFANLWPGAGREELSIDLMRFLPEAPNGVMDYLFTGLLLWGREQGYRWFNLGMAPLAGLENRPFAPLWNRFGALIFRHGENFYNFQGLRAYKEKFDPVWEPRYLASPGGIVLPRILTNVAALISGGFKGVIGR